MENQYRIGQHEFATREEWEGAKRDLEMIEAILNRLDIDDPDDVETVYHLIREGKIQFESKLGTTFFCDISDRAAQNLERRLFENERRHALEKKLRHRLMKQKKQQEAAAMQDQKQKDARQSNMFQFLGIACVALAVLCAVFYGHSVYSERRAAQKLEDVQQQKNISKAVDWYMDRVRSEEEGQAEIYEVEIDPALAEPVETETDQEPQEPVVLPEYASLREQYPDLVGWIRIDDTQVDLPVMQAADNDYYLHRSIDGAEDINGTLFLDYRADAFAPSTNLIIYGHNMKSGAMFGGLKKYLEESYVAEHDKIVFDTLYEKQTYQIIAVCLSAVGDGTEGSYRYYNFIQAESDEDFHAFIDNIRDCAVYDRTTDVMPTDSLLTLSTCNSYVEDGRLFIVAQKLQQGS